jgi:hypothetical protein
MWFTVMVSHFSFVKLGWDRGYVMKESWFDSQQRHEKSFLFPKVFVQTVVPIHHPILWVPGAVSCGVKKPGHECDDSCPCVSEV